MARRPTDTIAARSVQGPPDTSISPIAILPGGRTLDLERSRWDGPLDEEELAYCRARGVPLAYDCLQIGWVPASCQNGFDARDGAPSSDAMSRAADASVADDVPAMLRKVAARVARLPAAGSGAAGWAHDAELAAMVATMVRRHAEGHGLRAAAALHWALHVAADRAQPERARAAMQADEFTFRPWRDEDAPNYRALLDDPELWRFLPEPYPGSVTEAMAHALIEVASVDGRQETLAVVHDGKPVGQCMLRFDEPFAGVRAAEVAYWLGAAHQGRGWMSRILPRFLEDCMRRHDVDVIYAWIHEDHAASARVAERCGLRRDSFVLEQEWATATRRPRFRRHATYRSQWSS